MPSKLKSCDILAKCDLPPTTCYRFSSLKKSAWQKKITDRLTNIGRFKCYDKPRTAISDECSTVVLQVDLKAWNGGISMGEGANKSI